MERIIKEGEQLGPKDQAERVALFRVQVIGPLLAREFQDHGELADEIRALAAKHHRPPGTALGRKYSRQRSSAGTTSINTAGSTHSDHEGGVTWATRAS
jgi:hypothetical protein